MRKLRIVVLILFLLSAAGLGASKAYHRRTDDATLPVLTCPQEALILSVKESGQEHMLAGVTAWDDKDGDLTGHILVEGLSKSIQGNRSTITYAVADGDGHVATCVRPVEYTDYRPPQFALSKELRYQGGSLVQIKDRLTAQDVIDGDLSDRIQATSPGLSASNEGLYPVTFEVTNSLGDTAVLPLSILIRSYAPGEPRITLSQYLFYLQAGAEWDPADYLESVSGGEEEAVTIASQVKPNVPGIYPVYYSCTGPSGVTGTATAYVVVE